MAKSDRERKASKALSAQACWVDAHQSSKREHFLCGRHLHAEIKQNVRFQSIKSMFNNTSRTTAGRRRRRSSGNIQVHLAVGGELSIGSELRLDRSDVLVLVRSQLCLRNLGDVIPNVSVC